MSTDFSKLADYFQNVTEAKCDLDEERLSISAWLKATNGTFNMSARLFEDDGRTVMFLVTDILNVPERARSKAHILINLINYDLIIGNFEMKPNSGEIVFRNAFCVCDVDLSWKQVTHNLNDAMGGANRFPPAFQKLIWGNLDPREALASVSTKGDGQAQDDIPDDYAADVIEQLEEMLEMPADSEQDCPAEDEAAD